MTDMNLFLIGCSSCVMPVWKIVIFTVNVLYKVKLTSTHNLLTEVQTPYRNLGLKNVCIY